MNTQFELIAVDGPANGNRFAVGQGGVRLGRSSACEITVADPGLSRTHCLFEVRDGGLWVTDLVSANGTAVNGELLASDPRRLSSGDKVTVGETVLLVVERPEGGADKIDLGLGKAESGGQDSSVSSKRSPIARYVLWGMAVASVCAAVALFIVPPAPPGESEWPGGNGRETPVEVDELLSFSFEKVEAGAEAVYRYYLSYDGKTLSVQIDDVNGESAGKDRHLAKSIAAGDETRRQLSEILSAPGIYRLAREYAGVPLSPNTLQSLSLRIVRSARVFDVSVENREPPEELRVAAERLETFAKNEFGIWAIQYPVDKLVEMSAEARRAGDAKWNERDVQYGNVAAALKKYTEAKVFLDTVDPKPADYASLEVRRREVEAELERRFVEQRFRADRAIKMEDWDAARHELRVLCEMVPDQKDKRHRDAAAQLRDIETRKRK